MKITYKTKDIAEHRLEIFVEIPYPELEADFNNLISKYSKSIKLPGFRIGKVPRSMIINRFNSSLKDETLNSIIKKSVKKIRDDQKLNIYGGIEIKEKNLEYPNNCPLKATFLAYKKPECQIKKSTNLSFQEKNFNVKDKHYQMLKEKILQKNGELIETKDNKIKLNDIINITLKFKDEKLQKFNLKEFNFSFLQEGQGAIPEYLNYFYPQLLNLKKKVETNLKINFSEKCTTTELKGKNLDLKATINNIKRIKKAILNQEFLKKLGYENEEKFNSSLKKNLNNLVKEKIREEKENNVLSAIKENTIFKIPKILYDHYLYMTWEDQKKKYPQAQLPEKPSAEWASLAKKEIQKRIEDELLITKIKDENEINIGEEEMKLKIKELAEKNKKEEKEFRREIIKSGDYSKIKENLIIEKVFEMLYKKNKLSQKENYPVEDLIKQI